MKRKTDKRVVYILLCLGCITISFNIAAITAAIPTISADLKEADLLVSNIIPYYMIPYGLGALLYAPLTRYVSFKLTLGMSMAVFAATSYMCAVAGSLEQILMARIIMGVAAASAIPLGLMIIGEFFEKKVRGRLVGMFFSSAFFASLAGIVLSGIASWRTLFYVPAVLGIVLSIAVLLIRSDVLLRKHRGRINYFKVLKKVQIQRIFIFIFVVSALYHGVHKWFGIYLDRIYAMDKLTISFYFLLSAIGGLVGQMSGGFISDLKSRMTACKIGLAGLGLMTVLLAGYYHMVILGVIFVALSMFWTIGHNGISTILTDCSERDRPAIASLNSSIRFVSGGIGFFISSLFVVKSFSTTFFYIGLIMVVLSLFLKKILPEG